MTINVLITVTWRLLILFFFCGKLNESNRSPRVDGDPPDTEKHMYVGNTGTFILKYKTILYTFVF